MNPPPVLKNLQLPALLRGAALGFALAELDHGIREEGGQNQGPRIQQYLAGAGINVAAAWCAAFVDYCIDRACAGFGVQNPLEGLKLQALVNAYYVWAREHELLVPHYVAQPGDLALFMFGKKRYDHMGIITQIGEGGSFFCIEGNTNIGGSREGDAVLRKPRYFTATYPVRVMRWIR